jgi:hypothetical protein
VAVTVVPGLGDADEVVVDEPQPAMIAARTATTAATTLSGSGAESFDMSGPLGRVLSPVRA